jgi:hypothetical protein
MGALKSFGRTAVSILRAMGADENLMERASSATVPSNARQQMVMNLADYFQDAEGGKSLVAGGILVFRNPIALGQEITRLGRNIGNNLKSLDDTHVAAGCVRWLPGIRRKPSNRKILRSRHRSPKCSSGTNEFVGSNKENAGRLKPYGQGAWSIGDAARPGKSEA